MKTKTNIITTISNPENVKKILIGTVAIAMLVGVGTWGTIIKIANM